MTLMEPHTEDDTLTVILEPCGWYVLKTDEGTIQLHPDEFAELAKLAVKEVKLGRAA